jgi:hypothetical protein
MSHLNFLSFEKRCDLLSLKYFSWDEFHAMSKNMLIDKRILEIDSKSQFFLYQHFTGLPDKRILGIIIQKRLKNSFRLTAAYSDGDLLTIDSEGNVCDFNNFKNVYIAYINELFSDCLDILEDKPPLVVTSTTLPPKNTIKVTILTTFGKFGCEGPIFAFNEDEFGSKIELFLNRLSNVELEML